MKSKLTAMASVLALCLAGGLAMAEEATPTSKKQADAEWSTEGLQRTEVEGVDLVYMRPGATLADYNSVLLEPVSVAFRRDWGKPSMAGASRRIRNEDIQKIKDGLAALVREEVSAELGKGGYTLAEAPGDDVLSVEFSIVNLYINAPDLPTTSATRNYTTSVGEMTLVAELRDSVSGELLARILDRTVGRESMKPELTTSSDNVAAAKNAATHWAGKLRGALDKARKAP